MRRGAVGPPSMRHDFRSSATSGFTQNYYIETNATRMGPAYAAAAEAEMKFSPSFLIFLATTIDGFQLNVVPQRRSFNTGSDLCQIRAPWYELHRVQGRNHLPLKMATGGPAAADSSFLNHPLAELLTECKDFGLVRFISVNPSGSVLETAGDMYIRQIACWHFSPHLVACSIMILGR